MIMNSSNFTLIPLAPSGFVMVGGLCGRRDNTVRILDKTAT